MDTEIRFLEYLEADLLELAEAEAAEATTRKRRRRRGTWIAAVAGIAVLAFVIGSFAGGGLLGQQGRVPGTASAVGVAGGRGPAPDTLQLNPGPKLPAAVGHTADLGAAGDGGTTSAGTGTNGGPAPQASAALDQQPSDLSKIVRTGSIALTIPDGSFQDRFAKVVAIAHAGGGFVLSSQTQASASGSLTLRVPSAAFDETLLRLRSLGEVASSSVSGKDVTAQFVDYRAHLQVLDSRRAVLLKLMSKATTIGETIAVENELNQVQLQIDQIEGQLRYLNDQVAESTIDVQLQERHVHAAIVPPGGIENPSLGRALQRAVQGFLAVLATIVVGLGYLVPVAVIGGLVLLGVTLVRRRRPVAT
ncbi:MAG TPA: DUF4349 domain-containing protein [Actinomycetota bacterium]|nr:DUF4349 domain-containing protein [Actinomycetota bacterium]